MVHLLVDEISPRFGAPLQLLTDNGPENVNKIMKKTLEELNVHHVTTSFHHPHNNGKVERFHRTMHDILAKKISHNKQSWDIYINPLDNILRPRRIYYGEEHLEIALQEMHRTFTLVRNNIRKARKKAIDGSRGKTKDVKFKVGDLVYYKNHHKRGKLDVRWRSYYVVIENTGPVSYRIRDQLTGSVTKAPAEHLRAASIEEWEIPTTDRPLRKIALAAPIDSSDSDTDSETEKADFPVRKCRHRRENSDDESDVPLMEHRIVTRHRTVDKSVSTCDIESVTGFSPTSKDEPPEDVE